MCKGELIQDCRDDKSWNVSNVQDKQQNVYKGINDKMYTKQMNDKMNQKNVPIKCICWWQ